MHGSALVEAPNLVGRITPDGWEITERLPDAKDMGGTGGNFSIGYLVQKDGKRGFLKALNISKLLGNPNVDQARALQSALESFNFERDLLSVCKQRRCDRVVTALTEGQMEVAGHFPPFVQFIIFELAAGDVRRQMEQMTNLSSSWYLRIMHHVASGLNQLHISHICHQDTKP